MIVHVLVQRSYEAFSEAFLYMYSCSAFCSLFFRVEFLYSAPMQRFLKPFCIIAERYKPEPGVEPKVSRLTYEHSNQLGYPSLIQFGRDACM